MYVTCVALAGYAWAGATGRVPSGYGGSLKPTKILAAPSLIGTDLTVAVGNIFSTPDRAFPAGVRSSTLQINPYGGGDITPLYSRTTFQCASIRTLSMSSAKSLASLSPSFRSLTIEPRYGSNAATNSRYSSALILRPDRRDLISSALNSAFAARSFAWAISSLKPSACVLFTKIRGVLAFPLCRYLLSRCARPYGMSNMLLP
jgi:hypothetical protein